MADTKVSALTNASALTGAEEFHVTQGGNDRAASAAQMATYANNVGPFETDQAPSPATGFAGYGMTSIAGAFMPTMKGSNIKERMIAPLQGWTRFSSITGNSGAATISIGTSHWTGGSCTLQGATGWSTANTNYVTRQCATQFISSAAAGNYGGFYTSGSASAQLYLGDGAGLGGFLFGLRFIPCDTITDALMFVGLSTSTSAPTGAAPDALTNCIGVAKLAGSANLHIVYGGSAAQTAIDLGANFPANGVKTNVYEIQIFSDTNDNTQVGYRVVRNPNGPSNNFEASGWLTNTTPGTTLPASTAGLGPRAYRHNNATATAAVIAIVSGYAVSDH